MQHMAALLVIGKILQRLKTHIKDEKTLNLIETIIREEFEAIFWDFVATASIY